MAVQYSPRVNRARLDAIETNISTAPVLEIRSGNPPASCLVASTGTLLVQYALPSDWMSPASSAGTVTTMAKTGTWSGTAIGNGTAGYFRINDSGSPDTCHIQGLVDSNAASPTADMSLDNTSISSGQTVTVNSFVITSGNA